MKRVITELGKIQDIPYMLFCPEGADHLPLVLIAHGFNNDKYEGSALAIQLAEKGVCALTFDLHKQGARYDGFLDNITCNSDFFLGLFRIIKSSYKDIEGILHHFQSDSRMDMSRVGMCGFSLGAMLSFYALSQCQGIKAAVPIIGTPNFTSLLMYSMEKASEKDFASIEEKKVLCFVKSIDPIHFLLESEHRPLLLINAKKDTDVPAQFSIDYFHAVKERYGDELELYIADEFHYVSKDMVLKAVDWFEKKL